MMMRSQIALLVANLLVLVATGKVGLDAFEVWVSELDKSGVVKSETGDLLWDKPTLDLRVAKAIGRKGYDRVRISVISEGKLELKDFHFDYAEPFKYRWTHSYDLGSHGVACSNTSVFKGFSVKSDAVCLTACNAHSSCSFYTFYQAQSWCELSDETCKLTENVNATATYRNFGPHYLYSSVVSLKNGENSFKIGGHEVKINLPEEDSPTSGIIWADPCFSGRWIDCPLAKVWGIFQRSYELVNAVALDNKIHFFHILGDNFYDQDGRLTKAMFDKFSLEAKSKFLQVALGNHDIWVAGGPPGGIHDQYGHGFMQFYGQDTTASLRNGQPFNFSIDPSAVKPGSMRNEFRNEASNFFWYHKLGNLGFVGYTGSAAIEETMAELESACEYFHETRPAYIFLVGHWNEPGDGCDIGMDVPAVRKQMLSLKGCDIGDRLKYLDGHEHCNYIQETGLKEAVGFLTGGHGMGTANCLPMYGFTFLQTTHDKKLRIYHFQEDSLGDTEAHEAAECIRRTHSVEMCVHLATLWLETQLPTHLFSSLSDSSLSKLE